jgi:hypothetical protein
MSAMPHAHHMERVLESLAGGKTVSASQKLELQPQWRLISRDGSTSSVSAPPQEATKHECPDCLAGRCGQNPQSCRCSDSNDKPLVSLDRLTGISEAKQATSPSAGAETNAAMPRPKPQLFEQPSGQSSPIGFIESPLKERGIPFDDGTYSDDRAEPSSDPSTLASDACDLSATTPAVSDTAGDELQKVIDHWPRLPRSTRHAILTLVGALSEADSA